MIHIFFKLLSEKLKCFGMFLMEQLSQWVQYLEKPPWQNILSILIFFLTFFSFPFGMKISPKACYDCIAVDCSNYHHKHFRSSSIDRRVSRKKKKINSTLEQRYFNLKILNWLEQKRPSLQRTVNVVKKYCCVYILWQLVIKSSPDIRLFFWSRNDLGKMYKNIT